MMEFAIRGIGAENQVPIPLNFKGHKLKKDFRIDILIGREIIRDQICRKYGPRF